MHSTSEFVQIMLDAGADVNCELLNGRTPLHVAAEQGNLEAAACLLRQSHTKRSVKDRFGTTPLLLAAQHGKMNIAEMLAPWNRTSELSQDEIEAAKQVCIFPFVPFAALSDCVIPFETTRRCHADS